MASTVLLEYTQQKIQKGPLAVMGKSQKISKALSSSFVPDYRHVVGTVGESEGLGSSCRVNSGDSCGPKKKCISLNMDLRHNAFGVPFKVYPSSKMSAFEKRELELKLQAELKQVRALQMRLKSRGTASVSGSSHNGPSHGSNMKRGTSGRFESTKQHEHQPPSSMGDSTADVMKQCESLLTKLMKHPFSWAFNNPVDAVALNIPDYYTVINHPMDFGTIKKKISSGAYSIPRGFAADVRLTFTNAMTYNPPENDFHIMADKLSKFFEPKWKHIEKKIALADSTVRTETETAKPFVQSKKRKTSPTNHHSVIREKAKPRVTPGLRAELSERLGSMIEDLPDNIIDFLRMHNKVVNLAGEEEIEVDIDALSDDKSLELKCLLDDYSRTRQRQAKAKPSKMEISSEPGMSSSRMHSCKGNEPIVDEDVDVGGNDPPLSNYPPVEIEKDLAQKTSKCSSSSSSSSDSGSSSSDSDSGSSSGSESEDRGASPAKTAEGSVRPDTAKKQDTRDIKKPFDMNRSLSVEDKQDKDAHPKSVSVEAHAHKEGENAPSERQVSPDKLYRAALLRSRFADTILKAREKTLDQGDKGDPKKIRWGREELERQQREEKARIQAEAKAAEAARRQAELKARADARRNRELEREAARQALLKMEKTIEINENCLILKDLEMLGTVPGNCKPLSIDETSPDHSLAGIEGFTLGGSNPLELLGLFIKEDEEEEEDVEPGLAPANVE